MKKIIVTGGTGFIGSHTVPFLASCGYEVHVLLRSEKTTWASGNIFSHKIPAQEKIFLQLIKEINPQGIIHLATLFQSAHTAEQIKDMISSNITFGSLLLEAASQLPEVWFLNIGTFWQHINAEAYSPVNLYAATKQAFEAIATYYSREYPINFLTLCLNDTYGPGDKRPKIFNLWKKQLTSTIPLDMTSGQQTLDILYISDVVDAIRRSIELLEQDKERKWNGQILFASASEKHTLRELADIFEHAAGKKMKINWGKKAASARTVMNPKCYGLPVPGWHSKVSLEQGIRKFLENE